MPDISKPHDTLFKCTLQHKKIMQDWLQSHLSEDIIALADMSTLTPVPTEFIPQWPETLYSDVVYSCRINEQPGYFYIAAEHQSTPDPLMAFRVLRYSVELMSSHLNQGYKKLPIILPLVLYHGEKSPYPHTTEVWDCYDNPALAKQWALRPFRLIDLTVQSDEEINRHGLASAMEILFRHSRQKEFPLDWLGQLLTDGKMTTIYTEIGSGYFRDVLRYFIEICGRSASAAGPGELEKALALWVSSVPQAKEDIMTFAQQLREEGLQEGLQQGMQQGLQQGMQQGLQQGMQQGLQQATVKFARQMLAEGKSPAELQRYTGLSAEEIEKLSH